MESIVREMLVGDDLVLLSNVDDCMGTRATSRLGGEVLVKTETDR